MVEIHWLCRQPVFLSFTFIGEIGFSSTLYGTTPYFRLCTGFICSTGLWNTHIYMTRSSNVADDFFNHFAQHRQPHEWSFAKVLWACYWNLIEIINTVIIILIIQSSHTFSQVMAESYYDFSKIVTWSDHYFLSESNMYFHKIWAMGSYTLCKIGPIGICFAQRVSNT